MLSLPDDDLASYIRSVSAQTNSASAIAVMTASSDQAATAASDLPPKYEDLDQPPTYVEVSSKQNP